MIIRIRIIVINFNIIFRQNRFMHYKNDCSLSPKNISIILCECEQFDTLFRLFH